ncbi:MAG TPA: hypothetical protein PLE99_06010 [Candidatus Thiothrix moscowensis]|nr:MULTISPECIES: hypothetical protein [unclassified Thiothrix]HRJ52300.1 hypothetical protein [Candidatus Thiothrix moscowensis]HRJ92615.1 hypothetical protein [Candidatus Thiothrix moscowensis]
MKPMVFSKYRHHPQMGLWLGDKELLVDEVVIMVDMAHGAL